MQARQSVGIVGRSGTLGYEAASQLKALGLGVSTTSVGIGGDPINGSSFRDMSLSFLSKIDGDRHRDDDRRDRRSAGGRGGARCAKDHMTKPVCAYVAGLSAPKGRKMGHAGAIVSAFGESAQEKVEILAECGVLVAPNPSSMGETIARAVAA